MTVLHRIAHRLGWIRGSVRTFSTGGRHFVAFKCSKCGRLSGVEEYDPHALVDRMRRARRSRGEGETR